MSSQNDRAGLFGSLRVALSVFLVAAFLAAAGWYVNDHWEEFARLRLVSPGYLAAIGLLFLGSVTLRGLFSLYVLRAFSVHLTLRECFGLSAATTLTNFLLPFRGGAGLRALYLKRLHRFPYTYFVSTMGALYVFFVLVNAGIGLVATGWIALGGGPTDPALMIFLGGICLVCGGTIFVLPSLPEMRGRLFDRLRRVAEGWDRIRRSRRILRAALLTTFGDAVFASAGFYCALAAFSMPRSVPGALLLTSSQIIGGLASLTPGALGFQELVGLYFARVLPVSPVEALSVLGSARLIKVVVALATGGPSLLWLARMGIRSTREDSEARRVEEEGLSHVAADPADTPSRGAEAGGGRANRE